MKYILVFSAMSAAVFSVASQDVNDIVVPRWGYDTMLRWTITLLSLGLAAYLAWTNRTDRAQSKIIEVQRQELMVLDSQNKRFKEELIAKDKEILEVKGEVGVLRVKTDISQVLEMIRAIQTESAQRYSSSSESFKRMMEHIKTTAEQADARSLENSHVLAKILALITDRWKQA